MPSIELEPTVVPSQRPIALIDPQQDSKWDDALAGFPEATFFHTAAWAKILQECYRYTPTYFVEGSPASPSVIVPLMEVNSALSRHRGISLPFTDECEPLSYRASDSRSVLGKVLKHAKSKAWQYVEIRGGTGAFPEATPSTVYWGHQLRLDCAEEELWRNVEPACRRSIKKAERAGLTIELSQSLEATRAFHRLLEMTRRKHGVPPQPFSFFQSLQRHALAQNQGCIVLAKKGSTAIAGAMFLHFRQNSLFKYGASDPDFQQLRGNNLVMWHAVQWHLRKGFKNIDLGRTSLSNEGLRAFKRNWGASERMIKYLKYDCQSRDWATSPDRAAGWYTTVFRHLPLPLSRMVGKVVYRHIA